MELLQTLVLPNHGDLTSLGLVALLNHQLHKLRLIQICHHQHILSLLDIQTGADDQLGILF